MKTIIAFLVCVGVGFAQQNASAEKTVAQLYKISFASKGNTIELAVANTSALTAEGVQVEVTNTPTWLTFQTKNIIIPKLNAKEEQTASFSFSVEKNAEVDKAQVLTFVVTDKSGKTWKKEIQFRIAPPDNCELFQNYPNPFNPATTISYQLSGSSKVSLKVYDVLGREIANLADGQQEAGYHQVTFDARHLASGMYVYQLIATDEQSNRHVFQKAMMLLR